MYEYLDRRYALALYEIAEEKGKVKEYIEELEKVMEVIKESPKFIKIIEDPEISTFSKEKMFTEIFKGKVNSDIFSFLLLLIKKGRIGEIEGKLREMKKIYLDRHNTVIAKVKTVIPLTDNEKKLLTERLEKKFNNKVLIESELDPSIIGGVYIDVDNQVIDGTVKSKLSEMKSIMLRRD